MTSQSMDVPAFRILRWGRNPGLTWNLLLISVLAAVYYATARAGISFAIPPGNATAVWPPSGIALGGLLLCGVRVTPGIWIGSFLVNFGTEVSPGTAVAFATGNTAEALVAFWLCRRFLDLDAPFRKAIGGFRLFLIAAGACSVAATLGAASLALNGYIARSQFWSNWSTWWLGDLAGVMLLAPIFLWLRPRPPLQAPSHATFGAVLSLLGLGLISLAVFGGWLPEGVSEGLLYLPLISLFWLLLRFQPVVVFVGNLLIAVIAVHYTSNGFGPFVTEVVADSLFELQLFMTVYALTGLALVGVLSSQREAENRESQLAARVKVDEELRKKATELAHVARLATMGEMVAGIAHEINQPLYAIANSAAASAKLLVESDSKNGDRLRGLNVQISEQAVRAGDIIRRLRDFIQQTGGHRAVFPLHNAVSDACQLLDSEARRQNVTVRIEGAEALSLCVFADRIQIEQILVNLVRNSFDAMQDADTDKRVTTVRTSLSEDEVHVTVEDRGSGISQLSATQLFDPFFTTKQDGMGMGLAISRTIAEAHGGRIWAIPGHEVGAIFTVAIPLYHEEL